ncbi:MAG TPA: homoserine kinase [Candidatus Eisenbacteria bacterium]|nr:homoserine kinase [Candidatus Eisenbacteria bacterium]
MRRTRLQRWRAVAPASTSNLGPGFDCLGMAMSLSLAVTADRIPEGFRIARRGEGSDLALDPHRDPVLRAFRHLCRAAHEPVPTVALTIRSSIPVARGLGSSAAAITAGLVLANHWLGGRFDEDALLAEAIRLEGHPDNVAPALRGGLILSMPRRDGAFEALRLPPPRGLGITLLVPDLRVSTEKARALLPKTISLHDAAANTARALALLTVFAERRFDLLADALVDVYHVPHRARLIPGYDSVVAAGRRAGAYGVTISGSGPTLLAFHAPGAGVRVGAAMVRAFARRGVASRALPGRIATSGASSRTLLETRNR